MSGAAYDGKEIAPRGGWRVGGGCQPSAVSGRARSGRGRSGLYNSQPPANGELRGNSPLWRNKQLHLKNCSPDWPGHMPICFDGNARRHQLSCIGKGKQVEAMSLRGSVAHSQTKLWFALAANFGWREIPPYSKAFRRCTLQPS